MTAARSRCCACATWPRVKTSPTEYRAPAPARWPGRPTAPASTTRVTRRRRRAGRRGGLSPQRLLPSPRRRSGARPQDLRRGARPHRLARRRSVARRSLAGHRRLPGMAEERGLSRRHPRRRRQAGPGGGGRGRAVRGDRGARRSLLPVHHQRRAARTDFAVDLRHPARARWHEIVAQGDDVLERAVYFHGGLALGFLHDAPRACAFVDRSGTRAARYRCPGWACSPGSPARATWPSSSTASPVSWRRPHLRRPARRAAEERRSGARSPPPSTPRRSRSSR